MPEAPLISIIECDTPNKAGSSKHNKNYLIYIATRDGVDLTNVELERELQQLEYDSTAASKHADNEHYLKYINERPGSQGLFGNIDVSNPDKLGNHIADLANEGHLIYRGIISLREDDAVNLGFDKKSAWVDYMHMMLPDIAREFNIPVDKLQWTAAYHIKNGHPHCHYMFWNKDIQVASPYIHVSKQARIREMLSKEMFHLEREQAVLTKTLARDLTIEATKDFVQDELNILFSEPDKLTGFFKIEDVKALAKDLLNFSATLPRSGRLAYKLLPPENKAALDTLIEKLLQTQPLSVDYYRYLHAVNDISESYSASERHAEVTLERADEDLKRRMGNVILKACKSLLLEKERLGNYEPDISGIQEKTFSGEPGSPEADVFDNTIDFDESEIFDLYTAEKKEVLISGEPGSPEAKDYIMDWSKQYKQAISILYDNNIPDKTIVFTLLSSEAARKNVLALHQLAQLYQRGAFIAADMEKSSSYYVEAFKGFHSMLEHPKYFKRQEYIHYRLGKYYENGLGTEQDYNQAIQHYKNAGNNKYAQYSLGNMYLHGKGIELTVENRNAWYREAAALFKASATSGFPYAAYSYAKLCEENPQILSVPDAEISSYYSNALQGFETAVEKQPDDNLYYRLGTMYYAGKGTSSNQERAYDYFVKSAAYNNANAQYALGKTYADVTTKYYNPDKAEEMFLLSSAQNNHYATYALGKLYATPGILFDIQKAQNCFEKILLELPEQGNYLLGKLYADSESSLYNPLLAAKHLITATEYGNTYAQYALSKIYMDEHSGIYNFSSGFSLLQQAAANENVYAMAKLGSLYLWGHKELKADEALGKYWLQKAIEKGNNYAKDTLTIYDNYQKDIAVSLSFSLCRNLLRLCSSRQNPDNIKDIVSKVRTREAAMASLKKDERSR